MIYDVYRENLVGKYFGMNHSEGSIVSVRPATLSLTQQPSVRP